MIATLIVPTPMPRVIAAMYPHTAVRAGPERG